MWMINCHFTYFSCQGNLLFAKCENKFQDVSCGSRGNFPKFGKITQVVINTVWISQLRFKGCNLNEKPALNIWCLICIKTRDGYKNLS